MCLGSATYRCTLNGWPGLAFSVPPMTCVGVLQIRLTSKTVSQGFRQQCGYSSHEAQVKYTHAVQHKAEKDQVVGDENTTHTYHQWCQQQS